MKQKNLVQKFLFFFIFFNFIFGILVIIPSDSVNAIEYIFMDMEDGVLPYFYYHRGVHTVDNNSLMNGANCLNITYNGASGDLAELYSLDNPCRVQNFEFKYLINSEFTDPTVYTRVHVEAFIPISVFPPVGSHASVGVIEFRGSDLDNVVRCYGEDNDGVTVYYDFTTMSPWEYDAVYNVEFVFDYDNRKFDCTLSNGTSSETLTNMWMPFPVTYMPIFHVYELQLQGTGFKDINVFIDDWTIGTKTDVTTDTASDVSTTGAILHGTIVNDGSPLQNDSENNHTIQFYYDTSSFPNGSYTYYFDEYDAGEAWGSSPANMVDNDDESISGTYHVDPLIQFLTNHSGNITDNPTENITKVELRAKTWLPEIVAQAGSKILLRPVFNGTLDGDDYNLVSRYTTPTDSAYWDWSNWQDITTGTNVSNWNWTNLKNLGCRVIADFPTTGSAWVSKVEIRVSVNLTDKYANDVVVESGNYSGDSISKAISGLSEGTVYYYRMFSNSTYVNASSTSYGDERYFLTLPGEPTNVNSSVINSSTINITWNKGISANTTILVKKTSGVPSSISDGTIVYNGTGSYYNVENLSNGDSLYFKIWSYANWSNPDLYKFSSEGTIVPFGGLVLNCFNESDGSPLVNWSIFITNASGSATYNESNCNNPHTINASFLPTGEETSITFQKDGYEDRAFYENIVENIFYIRNAYLPSENITYLYLLTVIGPKDEYNADPPIENARMDVQRYINESVGFESIGVHYTDGNGNVFIYLIPGEMYKVTINADGYVASITDFIPFDSVFTQSFRLAFETSDTITYDDFWEDITIDMDMISEGCWELGNITIVYSDSNSSTTNTQIRLFEINGLSKTLLNSWDNSSSSFNIVNGTINTSRMHHIELYINSTADYLINQPIIITILAVDSPNCGFVTPFDIDDRIDNVIGPFVIDGEEVPWTIVIGTIFPIILLVSFGPFNTGLGIISCGISMAMLQGFLNIIVSGGFQWGIVGIGIFITVIGIIYIMTKNSGGDHL